MASTIIMLLKIQFNFINVGEKLPFFLLTLFQKIVDEGVEGGREIIFIA